MPIGGRSERKGFRVFLASPLEGDEEQRIIDGLESDYAQDLAEAVADFLRETAQTTLAFGIALYEIVYFFEKQSEPVAFGFEAIRPGTLRKKGKHFILEMSVEEAREHDASRTIEVGADSILEFTMPSVVRSHREALLILKDLSEELAPRFLFDMEKPGKPSNVPYEFSSHHRTRNITVARLTRDIGWPVRGLFDKDMLEYYSIYRFLRFEEFKLNFREQMLSTLNEGLRRVGRRLNFSTEVKVVGLPTQEDIDRALYELKHGSSSFRALIDGFL